MSIEWADLVREAKVPGSTLELMLHLYKAGWKVMDDDSLSMELKAKNGWTYTFEGRHSVSPAHLRILVPRPCGREEPLVMVEMEIWHTMRLKDFKALKAKAEARVRQKVEDDDWYTSRMTDC